MSEVKGRKVVNISVSSMAENQFSSAVAIVVAVCDDGTMWWCTNNPGARWAQLAPIPEEKSNEG